MQLRHRLTKAALVLALTLVVGLPHAAAAKVPRICLTVLTRETIDGKPEARGRAAGAILKGLTDQGVCMVDPAGMGGLAEAVDGGKLAGRFDEVDWIVVATVDSNKLAEGVMGTSFVRYEAALDAKVLASDSGEVVGAFTVKGQGMELQPRASAQMAAEQAAKRFVASFAAEADKLLRKPARVRLVVEKLPDAQEATALEEALGELEGVSDVRSRSVKKQRAEFDLKVSGVTVAELAQAMEARRGLGLTVQGFSLRRLQARFDPAKKVRISLMLGPFENGTGRAAEDWLATTIPELLQTHLSNAATLDVQVAQADAGVPAQLAQVGAFLRSNEDVDALLYCSGRYSFKGATGELQVSVFNAENGAQLFDLEEKGDVRRFLPVIIAAAQSVAARTVTTVVKDKGLRTLASAAKLSERQLTRVAAKRTIQGVELEPNAEPELLRGSVLLRKGARLPAGAVLQVSAAGIGTQPVQIKLDGPARKGGRVEFELPLAKAPDNAPRSSSVEVELAFRKRGQWRSEHMTHPVVVFSDTALTWMGDPPAGSTPAKATP